MERQLNVVSESIISAPLLNGAAGAHAELRTALLKQQLRFSETHAYVQVRGNVSSVLPKVVTDRQRSFFVTRVYS